MAGHNFPILRVLWFCLKLDVSTLIFFTFFTYIHVDRSLMASERVLIVEGKALAIIKFSPKFNLRTD